jgi:hypothetical protein
MAARVRHWFPVALVAVGTASIGVRAQKAPALPDVLKTAGDYVLQYSQRLGAVAAEEEYMQFDTSSGQMGVPKRIYAEIVWLGGGNGTIGGFRDVFAIDKQPVRQRDDRLLTLFKAPSASSISEAQDMTDGAVHYYISSNLHALDQPMLALEFLEKENQERSTFKLESLKTMNGAQVAIVKFNERNTPRLVPSGENGPGVGRFWIDAATGAVRQTELGIASRTDNIRVSVKYALEPKLDLWLPVEMTQNVDASGGGSGGMNNMGGGGGYGALEGHANYSKFRQVPVDLGKLR